MYVTEDEMIELTKEIQLGMNDKSRTIDSIENEKVKNIILVYAEDTETIEKIEIKENGIDITGGMVPSNSCLGGMLEAGICRRLVPTVLRAAGATTPVGIALRAVEATTPIGISKTLLMMTVSIFIGAVVNQLCNPSQINENHEDISKLQEIIKKQNSMIRGLQEEAKERKKEIDEYKEKVEEYTEKVKEYEKGFKKILPAYRKCRSDLEYYKNILTQKEEKNGRLVYVNAILRVNQALM